MNSENQTSVIAKWVIFTIIGGTIGTLLGSTLGNRFGYSWGGTVEKVMRATFVSVPPNYVPNMAAGFTYGAVQGFCLGFLQWIVILQNYYRDSIFWVFLNIFGYALAICLNSGIFVYMESVLKSSLFVYLIHAGISGLITGFLVGFLRWVFFRSKHKKAIWWLIMSGLEWIVISLISMVSLIIGTKTELWVGVTYAIIFSVVTAVFTGSAFYITFPRLAQEIDVDLDKYDKS